MDKWEPASEAFIWGQFNDSWTRMNLAQRNLWEAIRIDPVKWSLSPWGDEGGGFWVVAILGSQVVWYNDIEGGWNRSKYTKFGKIDEYWCNQAELEWQIQHLLDGIKDGYPSGGFASPPQPIT